jgi:glyoxylase-like metal-dependent hydrolase (beta-lactamase superfamily II)
MGTGAPEPLIDAVGVLGTYAEFYPDVPAEAWAPYRELYPELFAGDSWRVFCSCYLIRGDETVLVDTGAGPPGAWSVFEPEWEGGLLPALAEHGVQPDAVDVVVLTHVHIDHYGWNADEEGRAMFPRARYLLHEDGLALARERGDRPHIQRCLLGIADRLETFAGEAEISPGVRVVPLPGHEIGHIGVRTSDAFIIADAAPHPALLDHPDWRFDADIDHERAVATRRRLSALRPETALLCGHFPDGGGLR